MFSCACSTGASSCFQRRREPVVEWDVLGEADSDGVRRSGWLWIVVGELEAGEEGMGEDELRELARRIRAGDVDEGLHARLKEHVAEKLRVSNPAYLEKYE